MFCLQRHSTLFTWVFHFNESFSRENNPTFSCAGNEIEKYDDRL